MNRILDDTDKTIQYCRDRKKREDVIREILHETDFTKFVERFVLSNGGSKTEAQTIVNDSILNFIKSSLKPDFEVRSNVLAYIKGTSKNLWYQWIRKQKRHVEMEDNYGGVQEDASIQILAKECKNLLENLLNKLGTDCKEILTLWSYNVRMKEIAKTLNYNSDLYVKKKKHLCLKKLLQIVEDHPHLKKELRAYE